MITTNKCVYIYIYYTPRSRRLLLDLRAVLPQGGRDEKTT